MMIALFSDVHANLPALEAVLGEIDVERAAAAIVSSPLPSEFADMLRTAS